MKKLAPSSALQMEVTGSYEMVMITYKTTWLRNSEDKNLNICQYENLE
jgi:hypothetical protein